MSAVKAEVAGLSPHEDARVESLGAALFPVAGDRVRDKGTVMERDRAIRVLNAGSGSKPGAIHPAFRSSAWKEVRIDIDPRTAPDLVGSISDMRGIVEDGSFEGIWCSHCLEHLYDHEVLPALCEFRRILSNEGFAIVSCPNLQAVANLIACEDVESVAYLSPAGPIRLLDMIYGYGPSIEGGHVSMAHRTGFTVSRLGRLAVRAGFAETRVVEGLNYDIWAALLMPKANAAELSSLFEDASVSALFPEPSTGPAVGGEQARPKRVRILRT